MTVLPSSPVVPVQIGTARGPVWTVVVGGGSGQRYGRPKQYDEVGGRRIIDHSVATASAVSDGVVVVVPEADVERERTAHGMAAVAGGATRSESVRNGLAAVPADAVVVCVHDAARPLATAVLYRSVIDAVLDGADGAIPGVPVTDTIKMVDALVDGAGTVIDTPDRARLVAVQTPQAFRAEVLRAAHAAGGEGTDDAALVEAAGGRIVVVPGEVENLKVTTPADLDRVAEVLRARSQVIVGTS
jgi:2-C-methyl-D-erythritol 4-phosphate cytidylyltransferase